VRGSLQAALFGERRLEVAEHELRFHIPLIEPDWRISRIRLSDKTSRL
jgi:hypothetical protein